MFATAYPLARKSTAFTLAFIMAFGSFLLSVDIVEAASTTNTVTTVADFTAGVSSGTTIALGSGDGEVTNTSTEALDQTQAVGTSTRAFDNVNKVAQTFTPSQSGLLSKVTLSLGRAVANTNGDITVEIRDVAAGLPGASILASTSVLATTVTMAQANVDFTFSTPAVISSGVQYAIVVYRSGSGTITANYLWYRENSGPIDYTGGQAFRSTDGGATWPTVAQDMRFSQYYTVYGISGTQDSDVIDAGASGTTFQQLAWAENLPASTDIQFSVRASNSPFLKGDVTPAWVSLGAVNSPATLALGGTYRYFQWRATLGGTITATPTLTDVTLSYNRPPVENAIGPKVVDELNTLSFTASASDPELDTLTYSLSPSAPATALIDSNTGAFTWVTTEADGPGVYTFDVIANDGNGGTDSKTVSVTVNEVNVAPVAVGATANVVEDISTPIQLTATDVDVPANTITYSLVSGPTNGSITNFDSVTGIVTYQPNLNFNGSDSFTFNVFDGNSSSVVDGTISITVTPVNDNPVANNDVATVSEDAPATPINVLVNDTDIDVPADTLTVANVTQGANGAVVITGGGTGLTYQPNLNFNGSDSFTYDLSDGQGGTATGTVNISVNSVNDAPVLTSIPDQTINEMVLFSATASATDVDVPPDALTFSLVGAPTGALITSGGAFTWTPTEAQGPGVYTFNVQVSDGTDSTSDSVTLTVAEVNIAPVATNVSTSTNLATPITITLPATDVDLPANTLTYSIVSGPASGSLGVVSGNQVTYTPTAPNYGGLDSFTFKANDGLADSNIGTINVTITAPAQANPGAGAYTWVQYVALTRPNSSSIVYTVDGTTPNCTGTGTTYTTLVRISRTKDLKAIACYAGGFASPVTTWHYDIDIHATPAQIPQLFTDAVFVPVGPASAATSVTSTEHVTIDFTNEAAGITNSSSIVIPQDTVITPTAGGTFNGPAITVIEELRANYSNFPMNLNPSVMNVRYVSFLLGIDGVSLSFDKPLTMTMWSSPDRIGATMRLYRSTDGLTPTATWDLGGFTVPPTCFVQPTGYCTFQTTQSGHIALYLPAGIIGSGGTVPEAGGSNGGSSFVGTTPTPTPSPSTTEVTATTSPTPTPSTSATPVPTSIVAGAETTPTPVSTRQVGPASTPRAGSDTSGQLAVASPKPKPSPTPQIAKASPTPTQVPGLSPQSAAILGVSKKSAAAIVGFAIAAILGFAIFRRFW